MLICSTHSALHLAQHWAPEMCPFHSKQVSGLSHNMPQLSFSTQQTFLQQLWGLWCAKTRRGNRTSANLSSADSSGQTSTIARTTHTSTVHSRLGQLASDPVAERRSGVPRAVWAPMLRARCAQLARARPAPLQALRATPQIPPRAARVARAPLAHLSRPRFQAGGCFGPVNRIPVHAARERFVSGSDRGRSALGGLEQ